LEERFRVIVEHSQHFETYVQIRNFVGMRKHLIWYCRDFRGAAELRSKMVRVNNTGEVVQCLREYESRRHAGVETLPRAWADSVFPTQNLYGVN
jgi:tRNA-dihydrouridine synthase